MVHPTVNKYKNNKNIKNKPKPIFYCFIYTYLHKYLSLNITQQREGASEGTVGSLELDIQRNSIFIRPLFSATSFWHISILYVFQ